jgi:hypothetical protein
MKIKELESKHLEAKDVHIDENIEKDLNRMK